MDTRDSGKRSARITSALVGAGGLVVALVTGGGLWLGHTEAATTGDTGTSTSTSTDTDTGTSTDTGASAGTGTSSDTGVSQGTTGGTDATTTGS
ncbi:hypothetical protein ACO0E1_02955 [Curtobacterium sp. RRHDQ66]|uniref:hypothetical protein n=1 Tax=Curtobacterium guangdongense TaxID=3413380 RepID=UPI003BF17573